MRLLPPAPPAAVLFLLALLSLGQAPLSAEPDKRPFEEQAYLGLSVRDGPSSSLVVGWVLPGPLGGQGAESTSGVQRDDNVVSLDGEARDAAGFKAYLTTKKPGEEVTLVVRRSPEANREKAVPTGGAGGVERALKVVLARRSDWAGTLGRGAGEHRYAEPGPGAYEVELFARAGELGLRAGDEGVGGGLDALLARLRTVQEAALDINSLACVVNAFRRPLSLDRLEAELAAALVPLSAPSAEGVADVLRRVLDLPMLHLRGGTARELVGPSLTGLGSEETTRPRRAPLMRLVRTLRDDFTPYGPQAAEHIRLLGVDLGPKAGLLLSQLAFDVLGRWPAAWEVEAAAHAQAGSATAAPDALDRGVVGPVLWVGRDPLGRTAVVGGPGSNRYDMTRLGAVYDIGGADEYFYGGEAQAALSVVIDLGGDDLHESRSDFQGPATAVLGLSWLDDRAGNDIYRCEGQGSLAVGIGGIGVLIDRAGDDLYENRGPKAGWSMGVGFYGAGLLLDLAGHDTYRGEKLCQGVGGPLGLGLVLDVAGNDRYDADGPSFPSAYGTPGVHLGMSQGFGYGVRGYAAGGVGAIYDLAGDDRYTAGEFSQGGGYYFALGVLHDSSGNDLYHGNRYGQAFAAHQAVGVLVDEAGDDTYWSMTAASQSGAWDESITLLLDKQGDDSYRCDGLGQGSAAMQAIAILVDVAGRDRYLGRGGSVQGQGGGNAYHYDADKVFSFNALLDLGGSEDVYSSGRANNGVVRTGKLNEPARADSDLYGLFVDR